VELSGLRSEGVLGHERRIPDSHFERAGRCRCPSAAMLGAKRACADPGGNLRWLGLPSESEGDVPTVAPSCDQHWRAPRVPAAPKV
jgi:hypothetical protein